MDKKKTERLSLSHVPWTFLGAAALTFLSPFQLFGESGQDHPSSEEPPPLEDPFQNQAPSPRVLPSPFSPLEDSADILMNSLFRLFPSKRSLPEHLRHRPHEDFPWVFRWVPRWATAFSWGKPSLMVGNQNNSFEGSPKPIGERGSFQISRYPELPPPLCWLPLYFAFTTHNGIHLRFGARWDDIDEYTQFPSLAWKKVKHRKEETPPLKKPSGEKA